MDFITGLLECNNKNVLMVCCDKLGKFTPPCTNLGGGESIGSTRSGKIVFCKLGMVLWCT